MKEKRAFLDMERIILFLGSSIHFWVGVLFVSLTTTVCLIYAWMKKLL